MSKFFTVTARFNAMAKEIVELRTQVVSGFYEDEKPTFRQGRPVHELESAVTAEECTNYVNYIERLRIQVGDLQAKLDRVMLEYCPDEMTQKQKDTWVINQRPVDLTATKAIEAALRE
jgi:hypothetical protein